MAITITLPDDKITFDRAVFDEYVEDLRVRPGGIYVFYAADGRCLYVGQSKNLWRRLRSHFSKSPFSDAIATVTIYFIPDPYEREIYETHAITLFDGEYNRAKKYDYHEEMSRFIIEDIDDVDCDIDFLRREREILLSDLSELDEIHRTYTPRKINTFTGDLSKRFIEHLCETYDADDDVYSVGTPEYDEDSAAEIAESIRLQSRLAEINEELAELIQKRRELYSKLIV